MAHAGISRKNVIQTITFSKAFGVYGGAILCTGEFRRGLIARSSALAGNTPLPLPLAAAVLVALRLINHGSRARLRRNVDLFWEHFANASAPQFGPIIAITAKNPRALSRALLAAGIYPSFIRYPGGPAKGYFRFALSSEHTPKQIAHLALTLRRGEATRCAD